MPDSPPGTAVSSRKAVNPEQAWYVFKYVNPASAEDPKSSFLGGFHRAYRDSVSDQADFAQLLPLLNRLVELLEDLRVERDVVRSMAQEQAQ